MEKILLFFSILSISSSIIALYIIIGATFDKKEKDKKVTYHQYIKRDARLIKVNRTVVQEEEKKPKGINTQASSLVWTVFIGQTVGLYFLWFFVTEDSIVRLILRCNSTVLLIASFVCTYLTVLNGLFKKKMDIMTRLIFLVYSFCMAGLLIFLMIKRGVDVKTVIVHARNMPYIIVIVYYSAVIFALFSWFYDAIRKYNRTDFKFNFNYYYILVIVIGMFIGTSMLIMLNSLNGS